MFFNRRDLGACGKNVIIGRTVRIRYPELVHIGDNCIIDDFTYISTSLYLDNYVHIASGSKLIGGRRSSVKMACFSTLAPNVVLSAGSDDYYGGIATPFVPTHYKGAVEYGTIAIGRHCIIGSGAVVLPDVTIADGAAVGALSLVKRSLRSWTLYAGIPVRELKSRKKRQILAFERSFHREVRAK